MLSFWENSTASQFWTTNFATIVSEDWLVIVWEHLNDKKSLNSGLVTGCDKMNLSSSKRIKNGVQ